MEYDEIKKALEENPDFLLKIVTDYSLKTDDDVTGLLNNQKKLKAEKLKLKSKLEEFGDYTPEQVLEMEDKIGELETSGGSSKNPASFKERRRLESLEKMNKDLEEKSQLWKNKYIETKTTQGINEILSGNNVAKSFHRVLTSDFLKNSIVNEDSETGDIEILYKSEKGEIPLTDFAKDFFQSEDGQNFLEKPVNTGSGANTLHRKPNTKGTFSDSLEKAKAGDQSGYIEAMRMIDAKQTSDN